MRTRGEGHHLQSEESVLRGKPPCQHLASGPGRQHIGAASSTCLRPFVQQPSAAGRVSIHEVFLVFGTLCKDVSPSYLQSGGPSRRLAGRLRSCWCPQDHLPNGNFGYKTQHMAFACVNCPSVVTIMATTASASPQSRTWRRAGRCGWTDTDPP